MFNFELSLRYPFSKRFKLLAGKSGTLLTNKAWESNLYATDTIIKFSIDFSPRRDHGGIVVYIGAVGFDYEFNFYDTRHWCYKTDTWELPGSKFE